MGDDEKRYRLRSVGDLLREIVESGEKPPIVKLDPRKVPASLRGLIPLAERWGISDDLLRIHARNNAPPEEIRALESALAPLDDEFDAWLVGPEASGRPSAEYVAFSALRMFTDGC